MSARRAPARHRVGKVSYYQHHGSWYLYYRDRDKPHRTRIGRSETDAARAAALKNVDLLGEPRARPQVTIDASVPAAVDVERHEVMATAAALLAQLLISPDGSNSAGPTSAVRFPVALAQAPTCQGVSITALRKAFLEHHEVVLGSALTTVQRYSAATQHLVNFAAQGNIEQAVAISGNDFTRYLRTTEVAANGHPHAPHKRLSDKTISFTLQTCGSMYRFGREQNHLPRELENPFQKLGAHKMKIRTAKPIFVFDEPTELAFFQAAEPWAFAVHFTLAKTGLRPGELVHTLIEDVNLEAGWLHVRAKPELGWDVKTGSDRDVPLAPAVCQVLRQVIGARNSGPVFLRFKLDSHHPPKVSGDRKALTVIAVQRLEQRRKRLGRAPTRYEEASVLRGLWRDAGTVPVDRVRTSFISVTKSIGISATCPKSWRHSFATLLQEANVDPLIRQITLGHKPSRPEQSPLGMTGVYTHTQPVVQHREVLRALRLRSTVLQLATSGCCN